MRINAETAAYYIAMIETQKKYPSPEMMQRIAAGLELGTPELFSMKTFPDAAIRKYQKEVLKIIGQAANQMLEHKLEQLNKNK